METTERIVESYFRYVKNYFTISNIKCHGQFEIDLLAVKPILTGFSNRLHIESGVSISGPYSKLTHKQYSFEKLKERNKQASQRRTIGYFIERKFGAPEIIEHLKKYGFEQENYQKVIVTWGWSEEAARIAESHQIQLCDFRTILKDIEKYCESNKTYFTDDTLRTIQLFTKRDT